MPTSTHLSPRLVMICCHFSNVVINLGFGLHGRKNIRWAVGYRKCMTVRARGCGGCVREELRRRLTVSIGRGGVALRDNLLSGWENPPPPDQADHRSGAPLADTHSFG